MSAIGLASPNSLATNIKFCFTNRLAAPFYDIVALVISVVGTGTGEGVEILKRHCLRVRVRDKINRCTDCEVKFCEPLFSSNLLLSFDFKALELITTKLSK